jgi:hypothetical protein
LWRVASLSDNRFAAVVCDGGLWDMHEHAFLMNRLLRMAPEAGEWKEAGRAEIPLPGFDHRGRAGLAESSIVADLFERLKTHHPIFH